MGVVGRSTNSVSVAEEQIQLLYHGYSILNFGHDDAVSHHRVPCDLLTSRAMKHIQLSSVFVGFEAVQAHT
ncbi:hypothetical protein T07_751 [Trichinella nelsoni]|uniref:Uncharacterized protein n=2 Tax=Trichinella TaxID=6333 RepID=A0A0V0SA96_9BILA|nr:hypothetical protein T07_751 [Trichinella nelsoni]KRY37616.1 hypothetical protein T01_14745 [Trichinella spiralis]